MSATEKEPHFDHSDETWWGGWLQTAKEKSASAYEFVKNDLAEFTNTVQTDTVTAADSVKQNINHTNASAATERVKRGMSSLLQGITRVLTIPPDDDDDQVDGASGTSPQHLFDRARARLHAIQLDSGTYCTEPSGPPEKYEEWLQEFDLESKKGDISQLLVAHEEVRALYTQIVPSTVSHADFWSRYYYKVFQLEEDEARKAELMRRADEISQQKEEGWDEDGDDWGDIEGPSSPPKDSLAFSKEVLPENNTHPDCADGDEQTPTSPPESLTFAASDALSSGINSPYEEVPPQAEVKHGELPQSLDVKTNERGDMVVVGSEISSDRTTPVSDHSGNGIATTVKDESLEEDWEKDFDIEVTEEDIRLAQEAASKVAAEDDDESEDWENWE
ncbi:hypothetical protein CAPTEDRAFT_225535 [Capitella teleta]|uniref:BSD domain-containing protein n=1 Tax=Capitella teleta TaxID=283909 RepID=R7T4V8_CAPTE|nr:hypothetical protein CAPTEDRAFT_225535 [Capitella teleta]|eukprot:ELT88023.1 hypothetical protein CAPTEDRAFT_225535 [Capitella teleta]